MKDIKQEYEKLRKKYNLPNFQSLDIEFEIGTLKLDECGILIKAILRHINSKIGTFIGYLEPIVTPEQSMHSMVVVSSLEDKDKEEIFKFYKELSAIYHKSFYKELENEDSIASFIKAIWKKWPDFKRREINFLKKIAETWEKD